MPIKQKILNDILFILYAAHDLNWPDLNRTNLQKLLFLSAVLSPMAKIDWGYEFTNAPYGPFNHIGYRAIDTLVFHRYAEVTNIMLQRDSKLRANYKITVQGISRVKIIGQLDREKQRLIWISLIMKVLDIYGTSIITKLVYNEPTFKRMRIENKVGSIELSGEDNRSMELLDALSAELEEGFSIELDTLTSKLIVYFDFLSDDIGRGPSV